MRRGVNARALIGAWFAIATPSCMSFWMHPFRVNEGPHFAAAVSLTALDGSHGYGNPREHMAPVQGPLFLGSAGAALGYGHMFTRHVGALVGVSAIAIGMAQRSTPECIPSAYLFVTAQNRIGSVGAGPEVSCTGMSWSMAAEVQAQTTRTNVPAAAVFARWFVPFTRTIDPTSDTALAESISPTFEIGARLRWGVVFLQYEYFRRLDGPMAFAGWVEGTEYADSVHVITAGCSWDMDFKRRRRGH